MNKDQKVETAILREISITEATVKLREDGIVHVYYHDNTVLDVALQLKMASIFNEITSGKKSLFIFEAGEDVIVTKEARDNALKLEPNTPILASAVIANSLAYKIIANFFLQVQKPEGKYKVVNTKEEGIKWLKGLSLGIIAYFIN